MASSKEFATFVMEQLSGLEEVRYRAMMGEYVLYYRDKVFGGIYDDRLLVKPLKVVKEMIKQPHYELPYEGAKKMIMIEDIDNRYFLEELIDAMYEELPFPKPKKKGRT